MRVSSATSRLHLCRQGVQEGSYQVAFGSAGMGKRKQGDRKTPVGTYRLGVPRASAKFHRFIHVGYPTAEQRRKGFTGSAIGIHGPKVGFEWLGPVNSWFDLTQGCVAVSSRAQIDAISEWVETHKVRTIVIE